jgi:hypothetical protein
MNFNFDFLKNIGQNFGNSMDKIKIGNNPVALSTSPITSAIQGSYGSGSPIIDAIQGNGESTIPAAINNTVGGSGIDKLPDTIGSESDNKGDKIAALMGELSNSTGESKQIPMTPIGYNPQMQAFNPTNFQAQYNYMPQQSRNLEEMYRQMRVY